MPRESQPGRLHLNARKPSKSPPPLSTPTPVALSEKGSADHTVRLPSQTSKLLGQIAGQYGTNPRNVLEEFARQLVDWRIKHDAAIAATKKVPPLPAVFERILRGARLRTTKSIKNNFPPLFSS